MNAQILLYEVDNIESPTSVEQLISGGYLKESQKVCPNGKNISISAGEAHSE